MKLVYLGGANEVGATSILLELDGYKILLDCGIRQKKNKDNLPDFSSIKEIGGIDAIVVSHAHMDHIGSLPLISKEYPNAKIYMNKMTLDLSRVLLYDSLKIMNKSEGEIPIFQENDVLNMFDKVRLIPFQKEMHLTSSVSITSYMAGHIAGAQMIYIKSKEGTVLYTGDYSLFNQHTVSGLAIPKLRPDVIISEATYGDRLHANRESEEIKLIEYISEIINQGGKVLIPVFALGRSQEVLLILKRAFNKKILNKVPVYVDGMVKNINAVFLNNPMYLKESLGKRILNGKEAFYNDEIVRIDTKEEREKIMQANGPFIIVASSGMLAGGMSEYYASKIVDDAKNAIILTGYQDEESNGRMLLNLMDEEESIRQITLNNQVYQVLCQIRKVGLSAHADKQEMKQLFYSLKPKSLILGHGEEKVIDGFAKEISKEENIDVYVPTVGKIINLTIKNPRKQINYQYEFIYGKSDNLNNFYEFIKEKYGDKLFTKEDLAFLYYGENPDEKMIEDFTKELIDSPYFTQDHKRYFMFKITDELDLIALENKEITAQDIEQIIKEKFKEFPYKKISYYLDNKEVILTFDFPRVISNKFEKIAKEIYDEYEITILKNDNINNLACEQVIKRILGFDNVNKISYLPLEDKFKVKVFKLEEEKIKLIKEQIGYDVELILVTKDISKIKEACANEKLEQNEALAYIDNYFLSKEDQPYKKSLKNGEIILTFISYPIACKYLEDINKLEKLIGWNISLSNATNINMIFQILDELLNKYNFIKEKNPSFKTNIVEIKIKNENEDIKKLQDEFKLKTGLELIIKK